MTARAERELVVGDADYRYGVGELRLRVQWIDWASPQRYDGENWYPVVGVQLRRDGGEIGRRQVLIRGRRLGPA